jgi:hypothetical protein
VPYEDPVVLTVDGRWDDGLMSELKAWRAAMVEDPDLRK